MGFCNFHCDLALLELEEVAGWPQTPIFPDSVYALPWVVRSLKSDLGTIGTRLVRPPAARRPKDDSRPIIFFELVGVPQLILIAGITADSDRHLTRFERVSLLTLSMGPLLWLTP